MDYLICKANTTAKKYPSNDKHAQILRSCTEDYTNNEEEAGNHSATLTAKMLCDI
jgi:hypothetical protein